MYNLKFKRFLFWKTLKNLKGHQLCAELDRLDVFLADGSLLSIPQWSKCYLKLGPDFFLHQKQHLESVTGQDLKIHKE